MIGSVAFALVDNHFGGTFAHAFDRCHPKTYATFITVYDWCKVTTRIIDIRTEHRHVHCVALCKEVGNLVSVALLGSEYGCHELNGVICFQVCGAVTEHCVRSRVRFIKAVFCKFL